MRLISVTCSAGTGVPAYSRLFARDGEWVGGFGSARGPAGILAFMQQNLGTGPSRTNTFHILSIFEIDVKGTPRRHGRGGRL